MESNLQRIISSPQALTIEHVEYFLDQILRGLKYLHSGQIIHSQLRPENILVNANCQIKIAGLEKINPVQGGNEREPFQLIPQWNYQAPECILWSVNGLTAAIDLWSVGCIFAELLGRQLFFPAANPSQLIHVIIEKIGKPPENECDFIYAERAKRYVLSLPQTTVLPLSFARYFPQYENETTALDLLSRLLQFHPRLRDTADDALGHPFMERLYNLQNKPTTAGFCFEFSFSSASLLSG
jgi:serine/threonine protein kinase